MKFTPEYGIEIDGSEFKVRTTAWFDEDGNFQNGRHAVGRDGQSCAWYLVPPDEQKRLEGLDVAFGDKP